MGGAHTWLLWLPSRSQMLDHLCIEDGELIQIKNVSLPLATFSKFQPQSVDFLDITNPKAVYP
jgi:ubiquitin fusion degradation protein 1